MPKIFDSPFADGKYQVELWSCYGHSVSFFCDEYCGEIVFVVNGEKVKSYKKTLNFLLKINLILKIDRANFEIETIVYFQWKLFD